ncbi:nitrate/nitrite transporter [Dongia soli]|uniref:MFS transporter n=1 Tax=Dongia soli TaxID=600628 RepID=A0ABU5E4U4_9PROT|nr:MFS transporter [Dongia soli]MDY0881292.1 MFS transporter [Dongia soli]
MKRQPTALEITLFFTAFVAVTYGFGIYLFASLVAEMRQDLGFDYTTVGLVTGIAQIGFLIAALLSGVLSPVIGAMRLILGALATTSIGLLAMSQLFGTPMLGLLLTVMGAGAAAVWVPMVAVCQQAIPARHQAKALGLMSSGTSYGVFLNGLIVPPLVAAWGWRSVWLVVAVLSLMLFTAGWLRLRRLPAAAEGTPHEARGNPPRLDGFRDRLREVLQPLGLLLIVTMFLNGFTCMPFQTYLVPLMREDLGWTVDMSARLWSLIGGVGMVGGFALGWLADRISVKWAMLITYLLLAAAAATIFAMSHLLPPVPAMMHLAGVLFSLAFYPIFGLVPAYVSAIYRGDTATLLFGIGNIALGLGGFLGNLAGGYAKSLMGSFTPIYGVITAASLLLVLLALVTPNERRRQVKLSGQRAVIAPS